MMMPSPFVLQTQSSQLALFFLQFGIGQIIVACRVVFHHAVIAVREKGGFLLV
ncbi:MAG: hypothetical protein Q4A62_09150 [Eikenella sp.]|nr:hypothetical protein [Eikenella sp.]